MTDARGTDWTATEIDLIVADYFDMLESQLSGRPYSKSQHNEALQKLIPRSRKAIEFKHCNISAVLERLGLQAIPGYKPLPHFQNALIDGVERYLASGGKPVFTFAEASTAKVAEGQSLWFGPAPTPALDAGKEPERLRLLIRRFDPAARDARNRSLGKKGEALVLHHERQRLISAGRDDLARRIEWTSEAHGDGAGYDVRSFELDGSDRLIEVKTTNGPALTPFFLSENERAFSEERPDAFRLLRLYRFVERPSAFELRPPLQDYLRLDPMSYRASFSRSAAP